MDEELVTHARGLAAANCYLTLGTVDSAGRPWTSPVYFAADSELQTFYWVSRESSQHSRNLATRPDVSLAVLDSTVPPHHGRCLYAIGTAAVCPDADLEKGLMVYPGALSRGGSPMTLQDVTELSPLRLYRAETTALWVLCSRQPGQPCDRHGRPDDHRQQVDLP